MNEEKNTSLMTSDANIFNGSKKSMFSTLDLNSDENKIKLYNSLQECDIRLNDIKNQVIEVCDLFVEKKEVAERDEKTKEIIYDEETGEVKLKTRFRIILFGTDGKTYVSSAYGIYNSLSQIVNIFGYPTEDKPMKFKISGRKLDSGKETLILTIV